MSNSIFCNELRELLNSNLEILNEADPQPPIPGVKELNEDPMPEEMSPEGEEVPMEDQEMDDPEMQDADYMTNPDGSPVDPAQGGQEQDPMEPRRMSRLFDNFDDLRKMTNDFHDNLERIDPNLLDGNKLKYLKLVLGNIADLKDKIKEHMLYNFKTKPYEENMYIYMLLRAELLTSVSLLRKTLNIRKK